MWAPALQHAGVARRAWWPSPWSCPTIAPHDLAAPGGAATLIGRVTGHGRHLSAHGHRAARGPHPGRRASGRSGHPGALASPPGTVGDRPARGPRPCSSPSAMPRACAPALAHEVATLVTHFPGMLGAVVGLGPDRAGRGRPRIATCASTCATRPGGRSTSTPTWRRPWRSAISSPPARRSWDHPLARAYWIGLWLLTAGVVLSYRIGLPLVRSLGHRLRVARVERGGARRRFALRHRPRPRPPRRARRPVASTCAS